MAASAPAMAGPITCTGSNNIFGSSAPQGISGQPPLCYVSAGVSSAPTEITCDLSRVCTGTASKNIAELGENYNTSFNETDQWAVQVTCRSTTTPTDYCVVIEDSTLTITSLVLKGSGNDDYLSLNPSGNSLKELRASGAPTDVTARVEGGHGHDVLYGTPDSSIEEVEVLGGPGDDHMFGFTGRGDRHRGGTGNDVSFGEGGQDECIGGDDDDLCVGGPGIDKQWGEGGDDFLCGYTISGTPTGVGGKWTHTYDPDWTTWTITCNQTSTDNYGYYDGGDGDDTIRPGKITSGTNQAIGGAGYDNIDAGATSSNGREQYCDIGQDGDELSLVDVDVLSASVNNRLVFTETTALLGTANGANVGACTDDTTYLPDYDAVNCIALIDHTCPFPQLAVP